MDIKPKRRRHSRCAIATAVTCSLFNKTKQFEAIARNYSRSGIFFESVRSLSPGTLIVIRNRGYDVSGDTELHRVNIPATVDHSTACRELKMLVVGEVKRCEKFDEGPKTRYGIAVQYVSPSV